MAETPGPSREPRPDEPPPGAAPPETSATESTEPTESTGPTGSTTPADAGQASGSNVSSDQAVGSAVESSATASGHSRLAAVGGAGRIARLAVALAIAAAVAFVGGRLLFAPAASPSTAPTTTPFASVAPSAASPLASSSAASSPTPASVETPVPTLSPTPAPSESPLPQTAPTARITFNELVLDPSFKAGAQARTFTFVSDGPGLVTAEVVASAPADSTKICLSGDGGVPVCASGATPAASFYSQSMQSKWTVTLVSDNEASPTIDVALSWPSNKPSVGTAHTPFQGGPNRDSLRSLTATVTARSNGALTVQASWAPAVVTATLNVAAIEASGLVAVDHASFNAAQSIAAHDTALKAGTTYRMALMDQSPSPAGPQPDLTATIAFP
jgi:hypothetical protein